MKIRTVKHNNRKKSFELRTASKGLVFPYSQGSPPPTAADRVREVFVDDEASREAFTYILDSGRTGTVHVEHVLEYNQDPKYLRNRLLYCLTIEAQKRVAASPLSRREIVRRLGTSATQFYRLLDQTNDRKSVDQVIALLQVLDCDIDLVVRTKTAARFRALAKSLRVSSDALDAMESQVRARTKPRPIARKTRRQSQPPAAR